MGAIGPVMFGLWGRPNCPPLRIPGVFNPEEILEFSNSISFYLGVPRSNDCKPRYSRYSLIPPTPRGEFINSTHSHGGPRLIAEGPIAPLMLGLWGPLN